MERDVSFRRHCIGGCCSMDICLELDGHDDVLECVQEWIWIGARATGTCALGRTAEGWLLFTDTCVLRGTHASMVHAMSDTEYNWYMEETWPSSPDTC